MFSRVLSCFIIIYGLNANCINAWRPFKFNFTSIVVVDNPKIFKANGAIRLNSAGHSVVDYYYEPQKKLLGPILWNLKFRTLTLGVNLPLRINITVDICDLFKNPRLPPMLRGIYNSITACMDMPLRCPVEPARYKMAGVGAAEDEFPPYLPFANYILHVRVYQPKVKDPFSFMGTVKLTIAVIKNEDKQPTRRTRVKH